MSTPVAIGLAAAVASAWSVSVTRSPLVGAGVALAGVTATRRAIQQEQEQVAAGFAPLPPVAIQSNPVATPTATASPVAESSPTALATATASMGDVHLSLALPPVTPVVVGTTMQPAAPSRYRQTDLPTLDATEPLSREQGVLIVAKKDSGKTTTIKAAIRHRFEWTKGHCQWLIADPKGSQFCGLEQTDAYLFVDDRNIEDLLAMLDTAMAELRRRIEARRSTGKPTEAPYLTVLVDEWLSLLLFCKSHSKDLFEQVAARLTTLIVQGREDRVHVWLVTHSHLCGELGLSSQVRGNLQVYALGRKPEGRAEALGSIEAAVRDQYLLVDQDLRRDFLKSLQSHTTGEAPVCFNPEQKFLVQLPDLTSFVDWQYPLPSTGKINPLEIPVGQLKEVLQAIADAPSKSAMGEFLDAPKGGTNPKWLEAVRLWDLVAAHGVEGAFDALVEESGDDINPV